MHGKGGALKVKKKKKKTSKPQLRRNGQKMEDTDG
jgi:hypothetical protein